jgi:hypothetical protein
MKTVLTTLVVIAVAAFSTAARSQSPGTPSQASPVGKAKAKVADYYPLKVGTKWHYLVDTGDGQKLQLTSQIGGVDHVDGKDFARLEVFAGAEAIPQTEHLQSTEEGVYRIRWNSVVFSPPMCLIKYPLKPGQTWGGESSAGGARIKLDCSQGKPEEVQVPAGKYQAIPCTIVGTAGPDKSTNVFWFAEDVGIVKQRSEVGSQIVTTELTKYEPAK